MKKQLLLVLFIAFLNIGYSQQQVSKPSLQEYILLKYELEDSILSLINLNSELKKIIESKDLVIADHNTISKVIPEIISLLEDLKNNKLNPYKYPTDYIKSIQIDEDGSFIVNLEYYSLNTMKWKDVVKNFCIDTEIIKKIVNDEIQFQSYHPTKTGNIDVPRINTNTHLLKMEIASLKNEINIIHNKYKRDNILSAVTSAVAKTLSDFKKKTPNANESQLLNKEMELYKAFLKTIKEQYNK